MISRYIDREIILNNHPNYKEMFNDRNVKFIRQFISSDLKFPSEDQIANLTLIPHIWRTGDHFFKLAHTYYKNPRYWWIIAFFNMKPTEAHLSYGDEILIPMPFEMIMSYLKG